MFNYCGHSQEIVASAECYTSRVDIQYKKGS